MGKYTFEDIPSVLHIITEKLDRIESILLDGDVIDNKANDFLNIKEASHFLNLKVSTIYSKVCRREIPVCKKGKLLYFSQKELSDWVKSGKKKTNADLSIEFDLMNKKLAKKRFPY